ncbi:MAG: AraC family transcriptional regulator of arabinose operon [Pirellulaceae bacterium]|jgi:AraC family transcriptional regulator of arabinose operon
MPTDLEKREKRFLVAGCYDESETYQVSRPTGCHDWLLIYTARGSGVVSGPNTELRTNPHDVILLSPHTAHSYQTTTGKARWELLWTHFVPSPVWRPWLRWPQLEPGFFSLTISSKTARRRIQESLRECVDALSSYRKNRFLIAQNALEAALIWLHEVNPNTDAEPLDSRIIDVLNFIAAHSSEPLTIAALAKRAHLSESRLAHLFSRQVGVTPGTFLLEQRIEKSRQLLEWTEHGIAEVAKRVGFDDPFYFSRRFRRTVGMSPRQYRNSLRADTRKR